MADDFFKEEAPVAETEEATAEPEKIKVGDREFTQEELNRRIGLSDIALEAEEKYDRPISKFYPEFTKARQEADQLKAELEAIKNQAKPVVPGQELSPEELKEQALKQAAELGIVTVKDIDKYVTQQIQTFRLLDNIDNIISDAKEVGKPQISQKELVDYMVETGIKNPQDAYDFKFKNELKQWEQKQLESIKKPNMVTDQSSTAGGKQWEGVPTTKDNLKDKISSFFENQGQ